MKTILKVLLILILLVVIGLIALPFFIDPNDYKQEISEQVEKTTGRQLTIGGDIELSVFPWIALELDEVSLSNAKGFEAEEFAKVDEIEIRVKLLPLLKKQLEMDTIVLDGLTLNLETNKAGKTNWEDLAGEPSEAQPEESNETPETKSAEPALGAISIAGIQLTDANIFWSDKSKGETFKLNDLNLTMDSLQANDVSPLKLSFKIISTKPQAEVVFNLTSDVQMDTDAQVLSLADLSLKIDAESELLPTKEAELSLKTNVNADLKQETLTISALALKIQDLLLQGDVKAKQIMSKPNFSGDIHLQAFSLRKLAEELSIELPEMADSNTLESLEMTMAFSGTDNSFNAEKLNVVFDESTLTGQVAINNFAKPAPNFKLKLDKIDADRYMPPSAEGDTKPSTPATPGTAAAGGSSDIPLEPLRQVNAKGTLDIGQLKISNLTTTNIHINLDAADGLIKANPIDVDLYQGHYDGNVTLDARGNKLKFAINEKVNEVQIGDLLTDMQGKSPISGAAKLDIKMTGTGANPDEIKSALNGNGSFAFTNGALQGINIGQILREAKAALKGKKAAKSDEPVQTDFASLTGSFKATNGLINNPDLAMKSPLLRVNGAGKASLPKETIDYAVDISVVETSKGQGGKDLQDLAGITVPVKVTGTFTEPKPSVDMAGLLSGNAEGQLKQEADKLIKDKLGDDKALDKLKSLF